MRVGVKGQTVGTIDHTATDRRHTRKHSHIMYCCCCCCGGLVEQQPSVHRFTKGEGMRNDTWEFSYERLSQLYYTKINV